MEQEKEIIFNKIYDNLYNKYYDKFEKIRKDTIINYIVAIIFFVIGYLVFCNTDTKQKYSGILYIFAFLLFVIGIYFILKGIKKRNEYNSNYKKTVITEFIENINLNLKYNPIVADKINVYREYEIAKFDSLHYNLYNYDDHITGVIDNNIKIDLFDVFNELETTDSHGDSKSEIIFTRLIWNNKFRTI